MMRAEKVASEIKDAQDVLSGQNSPLPQLASLLRRLQRKSAEAPGLLDEVVQSLDEAMLSLDAAQAGVEAALRETEFDPQRLEKAEERLFSLRAASRKYAVAVDDLAKLRDTMSADLADLDAGEERLMALQKQAIAARASYDQTAARLSGSAPRRGDGAGQGRDGRAAGAEARARRVSWSRSRPKPTNRTEQGIDQVEFWVRTNPGTRPGPMMKVASGGELSRFLLALKVALADRGSAPTLVFDEIDTGVGGAVADAIGQRLARLSAGVQVLSVTHAPQVAARATTHFLISKSGNADRVSTGVAEMDRPARQEEIARMLAGATITDEARAAADRLLRESPAQSG